MRIQIDPNKLTDSPYDSKLNDLFSFDEAIIDDFIQDILNGNPTCYLFSGYRGSGKTSFIKKIESVLHPETNSENKRNVIFVHTSFARYKDQTTLLRKLIRGLYQTFTNISNYALYKKLKEDEKNLPIEKRIVALLESLYEKTFHEVTISDNNKIAFTAESSLKIDWKKFVNLLLKNLSFLFALIIIFLNYHNNWLDIPNFFEILGVVISFIGTVFSVVDINSTYLKSKSESKEFNRKTLYDDEIADYHFFNLLQGFKDKKIKVVFVLDELDKVENSELNTLIKEMKPYLVSGVASFIVIAGQDLYYKYIRANEQDDAILSSLFSKIIHIPLTNSIEFIDLFKKLVIIENAEDAEKQMSEVLNQWKFYIDFLIFKSKKVPRKFINLIRSKLIWENSKAYIEIDKNDEELKLFSAILQTIDRIDDTQISIDFDAGQRDHIIMQMMIRFERIFSKSQNNFFEKHEIIDKPWE